MTVEICGRCRQLVAAGTRRCENCGRLFPTLFGQRRRLDAIFSRDYSWSKGLCLLLVLVYLAMVVASRFVHDFGFDRQAIQISPGVQVLFYCGIVIPDLALQHEWWRLVLANFLHLNVLHIVFNASALLTLGRTVEMFFGPARFLLLFIVGGTLGFIFAAEFDRGGAGASSGICALLGAILAFGIRRKGTLGEAVKQEATRWIVMTAIFGYLAGNVNNHAHFGGGLAGFLMAYTFDLRQQGFGTESDGARIGAIGSILLVLVCIGCAVVAGFTKQY